MTGRTPVVAVLGVLAVAILYELLVALEALEQGDLPGEGASGGEPVGIVTAAAVVAAVALAGILVGHRSTATPLAALLAPAAALFMVAHFFTFDPYYAPAAARYADVSIVPPLAVAILAALACLAGFLTWFRRVRGLLVSAPLILACGLAAWAMGVGH